MQRLKSYRTFALVLFAVLVYPAKAQVERASIIGTVTDKSEAVMAGVQIVVTNEATNTSLTLTTDVSSG
jgi:hypothetical protein